MNLLKLISKLKDGSKWVLSTNQKLWTKRKLSKTEAQIFQRSCGDESLLIPVSDCAKKNTSEVAPICSTITFYWETKDASVIYLDEFLFRLELSWLSSWSYDCSWLRWWWWRSVSCSWFLPLTFSVTFPFSFSTSWRGTGRYWNSCRWGWQFQTITTYVPWPVTCLQFMTVKKRMN